MNKQITSGLEKAAPAVICPAPAPSDIDGQALTPPVMWLSLLPLTLKLEEEEQSLKMYEPPGTMILPLSIF